MIFLKRFLLKFAQSPVQSFLPDGHHEKIHRYSGLFFPYTCSPIAFIHSQPHYTWNKSVLTATLSAVGYR